MADLKISPKMQYHPKIPASLFMRLAFLCIMGDGATGGGSMFFAMSYESTFNAASLSIASCCFKASSPLNFISLLKN